MFRGLKDKLRSSIGGPTLADLEGADAERPPSPPRARRLNPAGPDPLSANPVNPGGSAEGRSFEDLGVPDPSRRSAPPLAAGAGATATQFGRGPGEAQAMNAAETSQPRSRSDVEARLAASAPPIPADVQALLARTALQPTSATKPPSAPTTPTGPVQTLETVLDPGQFPWLDSAFLAAQINPLARNIRSLFGPGGSGRVVDLDRFDNENFKELFILLGYKKHEIQGINFMANWKIIRSTHTKLSVLKKSILDNPAEAFINPMLTPPGQLSLAMIIEPQKYRTLEVKYEKALKKPGHRDLSGRFLTDEIGVALVDKFNDKELGQLMVVLGANPEIIRTAALSNNWISIRSAFKPDARKIEEYILAAPQEFIKNMLKPHGAHTDYMATQTLNILRSQIERVVCEIDDLYGSNQPATDNSRSIEEKKAALTVQLKGLRKEFQKNIGVYFSQGFKCSQSIAHHNEIPDEVQVKITSQNKKELKENCDTFCRLMTLETHPGNISNWDETLRFMGFPSKIEPKHEKTLVQNWQIFLQLHGPLTKRAMEHSPIHFMFHMLEGVLDDQARAAAASTDQSTADHRPGCEFPSEIFPTPSTTGFVAMRTAQFNARNRVRQGSSTQPNEEKTGSTSSNDVTPTASRTHSSGSSEAVDLVSDFFGAPLLAISPGAVPAVLDRANDHQPNDETSSDKAAAAGTGAAVAAATLTPAPADPLPVTQLPWFERLRRNPAASTEVYRVPEEESSSDEEAHGTNAASSASELIPVAPTLAPSGRQRLQEQSLLPAYEAAGSQTQSGSEGTPEDTSSGSEMMTDFSQNYDGDRPLPPEPGFVAERVAVLEAQTIRHAAPPPTATTPAAPPNQPPAP
jgi:hypothetical protein